MASILHEFISKYSKKLKNADIAIDENSVKNDPQVTEFTIVVAKKKLKARFIVLDNMMLGYNFKRSSQLKHQVFHQAILDTHMLKVLKPNAQEIVFEEIFEFLPDGPEHVVNDQITQEVTLNRYCVISQQKPNCVSLSQVCSQSSFSVE